MPKKVRKYVEGRRFLRIQQSILKSLEEEEKNIKSIAKYASINWRTAIGHLENLEGLGLVKETVSLPNHRLYTLTDIGKQSVKQHEQK